MRASANVKLMFPKQIIKNLIKCSDLNSNNADPRRQNPAFSNLDWKFFISFFFFFFASMIFMLLRQTIGFLKIFLRKYMHFNLMLLRTNLNPINFLFVSLCIAR